MQLKLSAPTLYRSALDIEFTDLCVEHSPVCDKLHDSFLASFFASATSPQFSNADLLIVSTKTNQLKARMTAWLTKSGMQARKKAHGFYFPINNSTLWICPPKALDIEDLPFISLMRLAIFGAHVIPKKFYDGVNAACTGQAVMIGELANRGHWFFDLSRTGGCKLIRYPVWSVIKAFPAALDRYRVFRKDINHTEAQRLFALKDVKIDISDFQEFSARRLFIKTDRPKSALTKMQQDAMLDDEGTPVVPFDVSHLQKYYMEIKQRTIEAGKKPHFLLLKYRRGGFTTLEQGLSYHMSVSRSHSNVVTLAHESKATQRIFRIAKMFQNYDPRQYKLVKDSTTELEFAHNGSLFFIGTASGKGFARGDTLQRVHGSEVSRWCDGNVDRVEDLISSLIAAASHGEVVLETTPYGIEWFAQAYMEAKKGNDTWTPIFLPWFLDPVNRVNCDANEIRDTLTDVEKELIAKVKREHDYRMTAQQIAFRREKQKEHKRLFPQEYPEDDISCFLSSGTPFFVLEMLQNIYKVLGGDESYKKPIAGGYMALWEKPERDVQYVAGVDTSEGLSTSDFCGIGIERKDTGKQVAAVHGRFRPAVLAKHAVELCTIYNRALCGVERNNHGHAVIQKMGDISPNGYGRAQSRGGLMYATGKGKTSKLGFLTSATTRPVMLDNLDDYIRQDNAAELIHDVDFLRECMSFKLQKNGSFEADPGCYDDTVFKWGICEQMRRIPAGFTMVEDL